MNFAKIEDIGLAVGSFLRGEYPIAPVLIFWSSLLNVRQTAKLNFLKNAILEYWDQYSLLEKIKIVAMIDDVIQYEKRHALPNSNINLRITLFKAALSTSTCSNWKDALLEVYTKPIFSKSDKNHKYYLPISYQPNAKFPIQLQSLRFYPFELANDADNKSFSIIGSTFTTNRESILQDSNIDEQGFSVTHILDSSYSTYTLDRHGRTNGAVVAIADGCGGHFGSIKQDHVIAKSAYIACRHAVRLLSAFLNADDLLSSLSDVTASIKKEIERSYYRNQDGIAVFQEGTTLACGRSFISGNGYRFVGFSIGDSMIGAWHPKTKTWQTLAPGRVKVFREGQTATAIFPTAYSPEEIHPIDVHLPWGTILIPLTDGVYDDLPCSRVTKTYADGSTYQETQLNALEMQKFLSSLKTTTTNDIITTIADYAISLADAKRSEALIKAKQAEIKIAKQFKQQDKTANSRAKKQQLIDNDKLQQYYADSQVQLGDDFSLFGVRLPKKRHGQQTTESLKFDRRI